MVSLRRPPADHSFLPLLCLSLAWIQTAALVLHYDLDEGLPIQCRVSLVVVSLSAAVFLRSRRLATKSLNLPDWLMLGVQWIFVVAWPPDYPSLGIPTFRVVFWASAISLLLLGVSNTIVHWWTSARALRVIMALVFPLGLLQLAVNLLLKPVILTSTSPITMPDDVIGWRLRPDHGYKIYYSHNERGYFDSEPSGDSLDLRVCFPASNSPARYAFVRGAGPSDPLRIEPVADRERSPNDMYCIEVGKIRHNRRCHLSVIMRAERPTSIGLSLVDAQSLQDLVPPRVAQLGRQAREFEWSIDLPKDVEFAALGIRPSRPDDLLTVERASFAPQRRDFDSNSRRFSIFHLTNSAGYRGPERSQKAKEGVTRIVVLGDSYGFGWGVKQGECVCSVLEEVLNANSNGEMKFEVLNFSVPGYRTNQERLLYETVAAAYDAQIVLVLMVFNDNPVMENLKASDIAPPTIWKLFVPDPKLRELELDYSACVDELRDLKKQCDTIGQRLMVASFRNNAWDEKRWSAMYAAVRDGLSDEGVSTIDLGDAIGEYLKGDWERGYVSRSEDMHPNEEVHRVAAEALASWVKESLSTSISIHSHRPNDDSISGSPGRVH